jgi:hypothetical protein
MYKIISFSGRKGSGKSLLTSFLQKEYNYTIINFADELKNLICNILNITLEDLELNKDKMNINLQNYIKNNLNNICDYIHSEIEIDKQIIKNILESVQVTSIRILLQYIGTDIIRTYNPDWHINKIKARMNVDNYYCFGDTRFKNEKLFLESISASCWFIIRPDNLNISNHISETQLRWKDFDNQILINNTDKNKFITLFKNALYNINYNPFLFDEYNINCFYDTPKELIYYLFTKYTTIYKDDNNNLSFIIKSNNQEHIKLLKYFLKTNRIDFKNEQNEQNEIILKNPFIIENLKMMFHFKIVTC